MNELIGKTVLSVYVNNDESILAFKTIDEIIAYETDEDCCSETWFADIVGFNAVIGHEITSVESVSIDCIEDERCRQESDQFYGIKIKTQKGVCDIVFRNSSNGYYGGNIGLCKIESIDGLEQITDDWSA